MWWLLAYGGMTNIHSTPCYVGRACRFLGKDYVFPVRQKVFCCFCGQVLDLKDTVECFGSFFCSQERNKPTAVCLISRFIELPQINIAYISSEKVFLLMRPMFTVDKDVKKAVFDFMRKAFIVGNVSKITGQILDAYYELTEGTTLKDSLHFTLRLEAAGTIFDSTRFQSMLVVHTFFLLVDFIWTCLKFF